MNNETLGSGVLLRNAGMVGLAIGLAWAVQVIGIKAGSPLDNVAWILSAAGLAGASVGLIVVAGRMTSADV